MVVSISGAPVIAAANVNASRAQKTLKRLWKLTDGHVAATPAHRLSYLAF